MSARSKLLEADVTFPCGECGRGIRARLKDLLEGRAARCAAGHRVELDSGDGLLPASIEGRRGAG